MPWAVPLDILREADTLWGRGPREEGVPPALRRRTGQWPVRESANEGKTTLANEQDHAAGSGRSGP
eukprot:11174744-Lingulodinium_polyedra.AAC.1